MLEMAVVVIDITFGKWYGGRTVATNYTLVVAVVAVADDNVATTVADSCGCSCSCCVVGVNVVVVVVPVGVGGVVVVVVDEDARYVMIVIVLLRMLKNRMI